jgi:hypothetical protein
LHNPARRLVGQVTETDTAQSIAHSKTKAIGQASETDVAQSIHASKLKALGLTTETELAQSIKVTKALAIAQVGETDVAQSVTRQKTKALGLASESDTAQSCAHSKIKALGLTTESDLAQSIVPAKVRTLGRASDTELAQSISTPVQIRTLGQAIETDLAQIMVTPGTVLIGQATEIDVAGFVFHGFKRPTTNIGQLYLRMITSTSAIPVVGSTTLYQAVGASYLTIDTDRQVSISAPSQNRRLAPASTDLTLQATAEEILTTFVTEVIVPHETEDTVYLQTALTRA